MRVLLFALLTSLVAVGCDTYPETPKAVVEAFFKRFQEDDLKGMQALVRASAHSDIETLHEQYKRDGKVKDITLKDVRCETEDATAKCRCETASEDFVRVELEKVDDKWVIFTVAGESKADPAAIIKTFYNLIADEQWEAAKAMATKTSQPAIEMMQKMAEAASGLGGGGDKTYVKNATCEEVSENRAECVCEMDNGKRQKGTLQKEDGEWKVAFKKGDLSAAEDETAIPPVDTADGAL